MTNLFGSLRLSVLCIASVFVLGCSDSSDRQDPVEPPPIDPPEPELTYQAEIIWTEYGIPHVSADDWGSLGYGVGYAYARDNYCMLMREYVNASGESAKYFGDEGDINADLVYHLFNDDQRIQGLFDDLPAYVQDNLHGYAAGVNRHLSETGLDKLSEGEDGCRGADWVRDIDYMDVTRLLHKAILIGSSGPLADFSTAVAAPEETLAQVQPVMSQAGIQQLLAGVDHSAFKAAMDMPEGWEIGSNAYAVGAEASQSDAGILFGNPHFPWQGSRRFFVFHATLGDEYNVMGAALAGLPMPVIGFNDNVAWTHTVSTGKRFTFYELTLNPDNPMQYEFEGEMREITSQTVSAEQIGEDGTLETVDYTFYFSHYGPIVDLGAVSTLLGGWPNAAGTLLTYRDANLENLRGIEQWVNMGKAANLGEFKDALADIGTPWVNTIAADRSGDAFYGDISVVPNVSVSQYASCIRGTLQTLLTDFGYVTMDGSDADCEWGNDPDTAEGVFGYDSLPKLETRDYAANANDSYWVSNPHNFLQGYSPVIGREGVEQSMRTRHTFDKSGLRIQGADGLGAPKYNIDNIRELAYEADNYAAKLILPATVDICKETQDWSVYSANPETAAEACLVLGNWDGAHRLDSVGGHIFHEYWNRVRGTEGFWNVPFNVTMPLLTPVSLNLGLENQQVVRTGLGAAVDRLVEAGIPLDRPWGEVQYSEKNGVRYGIHGGSSREMFSVITSDLIDGEGYSNIVHGNSYMQAVTWDDSQCPVAYGMITYSQSTDPASDHYADATELYSQGGWIDMPYCDSDRDAQEIGREIVEE